MEFEYSEEFISRERKYTGNIIGVDMMNVLLPNGKEATRDVVVHPGASVVIPLNDEGEIFVVKQFRAPIGIALIELPAGKLDGDEDPLVCAKRELFEETGLRAKEIRHITSIHSTPGFCDEVLHMYLATGLIKGEAHLDEDEFLTVEKIHISKLIHMILNNSITDAKTIIGILMADKFLKKEM
jgi:ADP-ribose pyrophosphatase